MRELERDAAPLRGVPGPLKSLRLLLLDEFSAAAADAAAPAVVAALGLTPAAGEVCGVGGVATVFGVPSEGPRRPPEALAMAECASPNARSVAASASAANAAVIGVTPETGELWGVKGVAIDFGVPATGTPHPLVIAPST